MTNPLPPFLRAACAMAVLALATAPLAGREQTSGPADAADWSRTAAERLREGRRTGAHEPLQAAEAAFARVLESRPDSAQAWAGMAYARLGRHDFRGALAAAREAARREPDEPRIWALLGDVHFGMGHYAEAEFALRHLEQGEGMTLQSLARRALLAEVRGDLDRAAALLEDALVAGRMLEASSADLAWCLSMQGEVALQRGRLAEAERRFREALQRDPGRPFAVHGLAEVLDATGRRARAIEMLRELVSWLPEPGYLIQLGDLLALEGLSEEAAACFARAEADMLGDLEAGKPGHLRELAEYWLGHGGDSGRALELALRNLRETRRDVASYETAAWALFRIGRVEEAAAMMTEALRPGGGEVRTFRRAAEIYAAAGDRLRARRCADLVAKRAPAADED